MFEFGNIKNIYSKASQLIKNFLLSTQSRKFLIFLFFFFISSAFWLLQTLNDEYEAEFSVSVRLKGVPNNMVITSEPTSDLRIKVKDKGTVLMNYMLGKSFFPVNLEFADYKRNSNHIRIYASEFEKKIQSQLNASTRLISVKPDTLEYIFATGKSKLIPVRLRGRISAEREYYITDTLYSPDSVLVYAPSPILDTIRFAYTEAITLENISDTVRRPISIYSIKGAKFVPNTVQLELPVDIYTEKTVEVPLHGVNFPADKVLRTFPSHVQVIFQVGMGQFKDITADNFVINISYEELLRLGSDKYTVKLKSAPKGIKQIRIVPEQIDYLIEQTTSNDD